MKCPILICALVLFAYQAAAEPCNPVKIVDGDTIHFMRGTEKIKVRIAGYDAPERGQDLGKAATARLKTIIQDGPECNCTKIDRYGRSVCSVTVGGVDVSTAMLRAGFGCIDERYTKETEPKLLGVLSRNRRKFRQPINVACPAPGRWGRPNSRVTSRHFDHGNASRTSRPDCSGLDEAD